MKQQLLKLTTVIGAMALVIGSVVISANAHIGASHSPFTTEGPDIRTATIEGDEISFCFDEEVASIPGAASTFQLEGYDSAAEVDGTSKDLGSADECVDIGFPDSAVDQDLVEFTIASLDEGAVEDRAGNENIESSVALEGGTRDEEGSLTDAPNLTSFDADDGSDRITYAFDQNVTCPVDSSDFGFYTETGNDGGRAEGTGAIVDCEDNEVEVQFAAGTVNDADRVFVETGSICGVGVAAAKCNAPEAEGGTTDDPDLTGAERTDDNEWTWHFDEEVEDIFTPDFFLVGADGTLYPPTAACTEEDDTDVQCTFANLEDAEDSEIAMATVDDGAVKDDDADDDENTIGDAPLAGSATVEPGLSDAPDLETCEIDTSENIATFGFDEPIDEASITASTLDVFDVEGNMASGSSVEDSEEEQGTVEIEFDEDAIADAVGCHVDDGAVDDSTLNGSPRASVGTGAPPSVVPSTTTATTTTTTTTDDPDPTPVERTVGSSISINFARRAFRGSVRSRSAGCERGRRVTIKKRRAGRDPKVGSDTTNRAGDYSVRQPRANGVYYAVAARKVFTTPRAAVTCSKATSRNERVRR